MKGRNGLRRRLKERMGFANVSESTRLGNLHAKALDSSHEVMKLVLQNEVLKTILYHEMNSKNLVKNKIVIELLERVYQCMINTINSKSSIGMLKTIKGVSQNEVNAGVKVLDSFLENEVCDDFLSSLKIREEEYNHFTQTTRKIIRFLKCFNGKVDNYSALI